MKIDKKILNRNSWYEDSEGNIYDFGDRVPDIEEIKGMTYHSVWPLEITEHICTITEDGKFERLMDCNTHIGKENEKIILSMVNSGDYTLSEALMLWSQSCERCMNVLTYKYLNGKDGYAEYSDEWKKCNTVCKFCCEES